MQMYQNNSKKHFAMQEERAELLQYDWLALNRNYRIYSDFKTP